MEKLTRIRVKSSQDGGLSDPIPLGSSAENVVMSDGRTLEQLIGSIRSYSSKNIADILIELDERIARLESEV